MKPNRAHFPAGENLNAHRDSGNPSGVLVIPTPFAMDDTLTLHWENISTFEVDDEDFIFYWGKHQRGNRKGVHTLGTFYLGDEEFKPAKLGRDSPEHYSFCRFDHLGCDYEWRSEDFEGLHGFDCTQLMMHVPKKAGKFKATTPVTEIIQIQFGHKGHYKLFWEEQKHSGPDRWMLKVDWGRQTSDREGSITAYIFTEFEFDFKARTCAFKQFYGPNENGPR
ncbi:MAG: hypothetical protein AAFX99_24045 [Myxococcota bacterium]